MRILNFAIGTNLIHFSLSVFLFIILHFLKIPSFFLQGLHTYIHPDDANPSSQNGVRAAIRRPGSVDSAQESKPRKKNQNFEFDENKAQIFRLKLNDSQLGSRLYFYEFRGVFSVCFVVFSCFLLDLWVKNEARDGFLVPLVLGFVGVFWVLVLGFRVSFERSASKRLEKQLGVLSGVLGFVIGVLVVLEFFPKWVLDFGFGSLDGFGKFVVVSLMGVLCGLLYIPAARNSRAFWLGTDQIRCNLMIINCGWIGRMLIYASYALSVFTSLLWISPFADLLIKKNGGGNVGTAKELVGNVGLPKPDFHKFRLVCLMITGITQILSVRANVQSFLNEAVLSWYQRLHSSRVPDLSYSRAKVFLHNHYLCLAALQFFLPHALVLLLLGLSRVDYKKFEHIPLLCGLLPCTAFVEEIFLFMAWWIVFVWTLFTSVHLALYRRGFLYVS